MLVKLGVVVTSHATFKKVCWICHDLAFGTRFAPRFSLTAQKRASISASSTSFHQWPFQPLPCISAPNAASRNVETSLFTPHNPRAGFPISADRYYYQHNWRVDRCQLRATSVWEWQDKPKKGLSKVVPHEDPCVTPTTHSCNIEVRKSRKYSPQVDSYVRQGFIEHSSKYSAPRLWSSTSGAVKEKR